ncbi:hypothetical protein [Sphingobacterium sp. UBA6320]|uniref:hypothetical protein n=1 Tax=Sphingobacterium sp. UBA6320 TaxID=1947510 RepID=UPI0025ED8AE6|nr:hypothetical protein [Sphingobacterium sp. UBA6320]
MSLKKEVKKKPSTTCDKNQTAISNCITPQAIKKLYAILNSSSAQIDAISKIKNITAHNKKFIKREKTVLQIKFTTDQQEEKLIQIKIQIYK